MEITRKEYRKMKRRTFNKWFAIRANQVAMSVIQAALLTFATAAFLIGSFTLCRMLEALFFGG